MSHLPFGAQGDVRGCFGRFVKINFSFPSSQLAPLFFPMPFDYKWPQKNSYSLRSKMEYPVFVPRKGITKYKVLDLPFCTRPQKAKSGVA